MQFGQTRDYPPYLGIPNKIAQLFRLPPERLEAQYGLSHRLIDYVNMKIGEEFRFKLPFDNLE